MAKLYLRLLNDLIDYIFSYKAKARFNVCKNKKYNSNKMECIDGVCKIKKPLNTLQESIDNIVKNNKIVVFSLPNCIFCKTAKQIIEKYTFSYIEIMYKPSYYDWILTKTGRTSVPAVFIKGEYIGGCNDGGAGGVSTLDKKCLLEKLINF
jgi:glutaredoxin 3